jgi:hemolysin III
VEPPRVAYKSYSVGELWADTTAHVVGVLCGIAGAAVVMTTAADGTALLVLGAALYAVGLLLMLGFSAAYNLWPPSPVKELLRRFDHAAIFVMIAGTFTPFAMNRIGGAWGYGVLAFIWTAAVVGVIIKLVFPRRWERLTVALYIGLGASIAIVGHQLTLALAPLSLWLLVSGNITYVLGVGFHLWERLPYQNAIWHWFVLAAAAQHYAAVLNEVTAAAI